MNWHSRVVRSPHESVKVSAMHMVIFIAQSPTDALTCSHWCSSLNNPTYLPESQAVYPFYLTISFLLHLVSIMVLSHLSNMKYHMLCAPNWAKISLLSTIQRVLSQEMCNSIWKNLIYWFLVNDIYMSGSYNQAICKYRVRQAWFKHILYIWNYYLLTTFSDYDDQTIHVNDTGSNDLVLCHMDQVITVGFLS